MTFDLTMLPLCIFQKDVDPCLFKFSVALFKIAGKIS